MKLKTLVKLLKTKEGRYGHMKVMFKGHGGIEITPTKVNLSKRRYALNEFEEVVLIQ